MSLDKAIQYGKEHRKVRRQCSYSCFNHNPHRGAQCPWCLDNRTHNTKKRMVFSLIEMREIAKYGNIA